MSRFWNCTGAPHPTWPFKNICPDFRTAPVHPIQPWFWHISLEGPSVLHRCSPSNHPTWPFKNICPDFGTAPVQFIQPNFIYISQEVPSVLHRCSSSNLTFKKYMSRFWNCTGAPHPTTQPDLSKIYVQIFELHRCSPSNHQTWPFKYICLDFRTAPVQSFQPDLSKKYISKIFGWGYKRYAIIAPPLQTSSEWTTSHQLPPGNAQGRKD